MEHPSAAKFIVKVEEAEGIFNFLSEPEKRQALQFLLSVFRRYNSSIVPVLDTSRSSESCKTAKAKELGDVIQTFSLLLEKQISKLEDGLEKSVTDGVEQCLSVEPACESNGEDKQQHTVYTYSVTENTGNGEKQSYSLQHIPPNRSKNLFERIYSPLFTWENTKFDRLEHRKRKPIERRQPIKLLVKTAYKQRLAENGETACLGKDDRKQNFSCLLCDDKFSQETPYLQHLVFVHRSSPCCCRFCHQLLTSTQSIQTHNSLCGESNHLQTLNSRETLRNLLAPNLISSGTENQTHAEILETQSKDSSCSRSRPAGQFHRQVHTEEKPFQCCKCRTSFRTMKGLLKHRQTNRHLVKEGNVINEKKYLCSMCGRKYFRKQALQRHLKNHKEEAPHQCEFCSFTSKEANNLKRHMDLHFESKRNFVCEVCGAAFHAKNTLDTHIAFKHNDSRLFQCNVCEATFKVKNALKRHSLVHSELKSHKCWCGVGFKRLTNLRRHMLRIHGSTDGLLPPVKRVKSLDSNKKAPVSRTDLVEHSVADLSVADTNTHVVPFNQDTKVTNGASLVPLPQDTFRDQLRGVADVSSGQGETCGNGITVAPILLNNKNNARLSLHKLYPDNPQCNSSALPQSVGLSNVIRQIQEVFDLS